MSVILEFLTWNYEGHILIDNFFKDIKNEGPNFIKYYRKNNNKNKIISHGRIYKPLSLSIEKINEAFFKFDSLDTEIEIIILSNKQSIFEHKSVNDIVLLFNIIDANNKNEPEYSSNRDEVGFNNAFEKSVSHSNLVGGEDKVDLINKNGSFYNHKKKHFSKKITK